MKIHENMLVNEILDIDPDVTDVFLKHGLNCLGCPGSQTESLKEAADAHGVNMSKLIEDLENYLNQ